jgi:integrase
VLLNCGLRPAEAYALKWDDLVGDTLHVQRALVKRRKYGFELAEPKTSQSRRGVVVMPSTLEALNTHRALQAQEILKRGRRYQRNGLIFANANGRPLSHANVTKAFKDALTAAGLQHMRMYDLRHTHATAMLQSGNNIKVVSERLGHSSIVITADTYSHVSPTMQRQAVGQYEACLKAASAVREIA